MKLTLEKQSSELSRLNAELATAESTAGIYKTQADVLQQSIADVRGKVKLALKSQTSYEREIISNMRLLTADSQNKKAVEDLETARASQAADQLDVTNLKQAIKGLQGDSQNLRKKQAAAERQLVKVLRERTEVSNATIVEETPVVQSDVNSEKQV